MKTYDGYDHQYWMDGLEPMDDYNVRHLLAMFARLGVPKSYLDVGCGTGAMVHAARKLGVEAYGVDQLVEEGKWPPYFFHRNLVDPFILPVKRVELITCFEVGEHLHESAHATLCDTISNNLALGGNYLLFSAARPGQAGTGHIALRPAEYWHNEFKIRDFSFNSVLTMNLAHIFAIINTPLSYLWDNLMVFER